MWVIYYKGFVPAVWRCFVPLDCDTPTTPTETNDQDGNGDKDEDDNINKWNNTQFSERDNKHMNMKR